MSGPRLAVLGAQATQVSIYRDRGVGRYVRAHVAALTAAAPQRIAAVELTESLAAPEALELAGRPLRFAGPASHAPAGPLLYHAMAPLDWQPLALAWPRWARRADVALAVTVFDAIPAQFPERYLDTAARRAAYGLRCELIRAADAVLAISQASAADAVERLGADPRVVHTIGGAVPAAPIAALADPFAAARIAVEGLQRGFLLCVAGPDWRKNVGTLLHAYALTEPALRARHQLVIAGCARPGDARGELRAQADALRLPEGRVLLAGPLADAELAALHQACEAAVCVSLAEGFGLPLLEALVAGGAVVASDIPAHAELLPEPRARFDAHDPRAVRDALTAVCETPLREQLRARAPVWAAAHSWSAVAERTLAAYDAADARRPARRPPRAVEPFALLSPLPPQRTGVAAYSWGLAAALAEQVPVELYREGAGSPPAQPRGVSVHDAGELPWRLAARDARREPLICLGNSPFHIRGWRALMRDGGAVLLHDVCLLGLHHALVALGLIGEQRLEQLVWRLDAQRLPPELRERGPHALPYEELYRHGVLLVGDVLDNAQTVLVHSEQARELVLAERPRRAQDVFVVPFACPAPPPARVPAPGGDPLVATFGYTKLAELFIDAAALVARALPAVRFAIVGAEDRPGREQELRERIRKLGIERICEVTGWCSEQDYRARLRAATVAVQLRETAFGERSAGIADCLSAGLPTIATRRGAASELPASAIVHLDGGPTAASVSEAVIKLLGDHAQRERLGDGALRYAREHSFGHAATAILRALDGGRRVGS